MIPLSGPLFFGAIALLLVAAPALVYLTYLVARGLWSLFRANRCRNFAEMAARKHREGDIPGAVSLYLKAEANWSLNSWDGGRDSLLKDLERLGNIGSGLVRTQARDSGMAYADFNATIREMRDVLRERGNFGIDGRKMLPDVIVRWQASVQRLNVSRNRLRDICRPTKIGRR